MILSHPTVFVNQQQPQTSSWIVGYGFNETSVIEPVVKVVCADIRQAVGFLKILFILVRQLDSAAQTLMRLSEHCWVARDGETFVKYETLAQWCRVPYITFRKHISQLEQKGWIENMGRKCTATKRGYKTTRLRVNMLRLEDAQQQSKTFLCIPNFTFEWPWSERIVYAYYLMKCEMNEGEPDGTDLHHGFCTDSYKTIGDALGLNWKTVRSASNRLHADGWLYRLEDRGSPNMISVTLAPKAASLCNRVQSHQRVAYQRGPIPIRIIHPYQNVSSTHTKMDHPNREELEGRTLMEDGSLRSPSDRPGHFPVPGMETQNPAGIPSVAVVTPSTGRLPEAERRMDHCIKVKVLPANRLRRMTLRKVRELGQPGVNCIKVYSLN